MVQLEDRNSSELSAVCERNRALDYLVNLTAMFPHQKIHINEFTINHKEVSCLLSAGVTTRPSHSVQNSPEYYIIKTYNIITTTFN